MSNTNLFHLATSNDPIRVSISDNSYVSAYEDRNGWAHRQYSVRVSFQGRYALFTYSSGMAVKRASHRDVLHSLASDMGWWDCSVEDFAYECGYASIADAEYVKSVIDREHDKLKRIFGRHYNSFVNTFATEE